MSGGSKIVELIKQQAAAAAQRGLELATVKSVSPLSIRIDNMGVDLGASFLLVAHHLLEHEVTAEADDMSVAGTTTAAGSGPHVHAIYELDLNESDILIEGCLEVGDRVAVMPCAGGQKYMILDKVVSAS